MTYQHNSHIIIQELKALLYQVDLIISEIKLSLKVSLMLFHSIDALNLIDIS
jgi:hypothetical protein